MSDESELALTRKEGGDSLVLSRTRSELVARGRKDAAALEAQSRSSSDDSDEAELRRRAEQGDAAAQFELGSKYHRGDGVLQDYDEAVRWYRMAAGQGQVAAQCNIRLLYDNEDEVFGDWSSQEYSEYPYAFQDSDFGFQYDHSLCVPLPDAKGMQRYRLAADQGDIAAQHTLAYFYVRSDEEPDNDAAAVKWFHHSAEQGDAASQCNLGFMLAHGRGVPQDYAAAAIWFRRAAEQDRIPAVLNLTLAYGLGRGVLRDHSAAENWRIKLMDLWDATGDRWYIWYRIAAEQGDALVQTMLGSWWHRGELWCRPQSDEESAKWYGLAAHQGDADAQFQLGEYYHKEQPKN